MSLSRRSARFAGRVSWCGGQGAGGVGLGGAGGRRHPSVLQQERVHRHGLDRTLQVRGRGAFPQQVSVGRGAREDEKLQEQWDV